MPATSNGNPSIPAFGCQRLIDSFLAADEAFLHDEQAARATASGLYTGHISTEGGYRCKRWVGGNLLELERITNKSRKESGRRAPRQMALPGLGEMTNGSGSARKKKRGVIRRFSRDSRRRLMQRLAKVNKGAYRVEPAFITLTYPREWEADGRAWKRHTDAFRKKFERKWGYYSILWKLEFQKRGAPHFHLLVFMDSELPWTRRFMTWLSRAWYTSVGSGDYRNLLAGTNVREKRGWSRSMRYASKYVGKVVDVEAAVGRWWGVWNWTKTACELHEVTLSYRQYVQLHRVIRRCKSKRVKAKKKQTAAENIWTFLEYDEAGRIIGYVMEQEKGPESPGLWRDSGPSG